ncbi:DUF362 domain-containing protein [Pseudodesulfovibrio sp.]|uniref:DUF362 domain-containing protein n=1 Tax=Pseudodesulfovibrio sp. TaxID=2035812 RepID=UPI0026283741|nr:DUF362 domain-containing protein [Pseudodesulfovibrio sp.]MDD3311996.1 DUF362 domain-containing protein [Pseudodesulfovibrio sp.]
MPATVALTRVPGYDAARLDPATALVLETSGATVPPGARVLVKPNLVSAANARFCTTHPGVVRAACAWLLDHGARVTVADSPAFGPAGRVARASGLDEALRPLGLRVRTLARPVPLPLSDGTAVGVSRDALEADLVLNAPKLKVHGQMAMSGAVKNLFGCVVGCRKALAHYRLGHEPERFRAMLMDVCLALPRTAHLLDGVQPLHRDGPIKGEPFDLGLLGASLNPVALDAAAYDIFGLGPDAVPLWAEALARGLPGARPEDAAYPLLTPAEFDAAGFTPSPAKDLSFAPMRLLRGRVKSLIAYVRRAG